MGQPFGGNKNGEKRLYQPNSIGTNCYTLIHNHPTLMRFQALDHYRTMFWLTISNVWALQISILHEKDHFNDFLWKFYKWWQLFFKIAGFSIFSQYSKDSSWQILLETYEVNAIFFLKPKIIPLLANINIEMLDACRENDCRFIRANLGSDVAISHKFWESLAFILQYAIFCIKIWR